MITAMFKRVGQLRRPEDLSEPSSNANPYLEPPLLHSEALGLGPETCSINRSVPGASGTGALKRGFLSQKPWETALKGREQSQGEKLLGLPLESTKGLSSHVSNRAILKHIQVFNGWGKKAENDKMKGNYLTWTAQHCGREIAILWLLAFKTVFKRVCGVLFYLGFFLWRPRSHIRKEAEEINREPSFILQKLIFHRIKDSCMPFKILHTVNKYTGLSFTAQNTAWLGVARSVQVGLFKTSCHSIQI